MEYCVFSKRFASLGFSDLGKALKRIGIAGVDLTVRPGGHVEPESAGEQLPAAVEQLAGEGLKVSMISTGITSLDDPGARETLEAAGKLGIGFAKLGYFKYQGFGTVRRTMDEAGAKLKALAAAAGELGVFLGCHNHSGNFIGAHLAHLRELVDDLDPAAIGLYFDPVHAVLEGGRSGWLQALDDVAARVRMVAVKDFVATPEGGLECVPVGQGVVPWPEVAAILRGLGDRIGPVSIHSEKDQPVEPALELARSDLVALQEMVSASA